MSTVKAVSTGQLKKKIGNSILSLYFVYAFFFLIAKFITYKASSIASVLVNALETKV